MVLLHPIDGKISVTITTKHAASSYNIPVIVFSDGSALGPFDIQANGYTLAEASLIERQALERGRYHSLLS